MNASTTGAFGPATEEAQISPDIMAAAVTPAAEANLELSVAETSASERDAYWRREVAARLERYRSRRKPRAPRYPSLRLPFDSAQNPAFSSTLASDSIPVTPAAMAPQMPLAAGARELAAGGIAPSPQVLEGSSPWSEPESSNLIEFPRSAVIPVFRGTELAEPVFDRPRIVEAPEVVPPAPALGGILIETAPSHEIDRTSALHIRRTSFARRILAALIDLLILGVPLAGFAEIFDQINPDRAPVPLMAAGLSAVALMLWSAYEFLLVVYTGGTPGWRLARLRLVKFDGSPVRRSLRRWRVLASFLSAFSLGLGYLWSVLDEDGLCWHDRITHTCLEPHLPAKRAEGHNELR